MAQFERDTDAKKLARAKAWMTIRPRPDARIAVLTGPQNGDMRAARALGVAEANMLGIDIDPEKIERSRRVAPGARFECADVLVALKGTPERSLDVLFLDFCGMPSTSVPLWAEATRKVKSGGFTCLGVCRERGAKAPKNLGDSPYAQYKYVKDLTRQAFGSRGLAFVPSEHLPYLSYHSEASPGSASGTQMLYVFGTVEEGTDGVREGWLQSVGGAKIDTREAASTVRSEALRVAREKGARVAADLYNLNHNSIAGFMAAETRKAKAKKAPKPTPEVLAPQTSTPEDRFREAVRPYRAAARAGTPTPAAVIKARTAPTPAEALTADLTAEIRQETPLERKRRMDRERQARLRQDPEQRERLRTQYRKCTAGRRLDPERLERRRAKNREADRARRAAKKAPSLSPCGIHQSVTPIKTCLICECAAAETRDLPVRRTSRFVGV